MTTTAQIAANRANAQNSTGPVSAEGKEKVSQNSTRHGLTARKLTMSAEDQAKFDDFLTDLSCKFNPSSPAEWTLLRRSAEYQWRLDASFAIEAAFMDECVNRIAEENEGIGYPEAQSLIFLDPRYHPRLNLLMRYRSQLDRGYRKANVELEAMVAKRLEAEQSAAEDDALESIREAMAAKAKEAKPTRHNGFVSQSDSEPETAHPDTGLDSPEVAAAWREETQTPPSDV